MNSTLHVHVVCAWPDAAWQQVVHLPPGATVQDAVQASGVLQALPELSGAADIAVGIYGRLTDLNDPLHDGDRVELYRPLQLDPKESRRRRAAHKSRTRPHSDTQSPGGARP